VHRQRQHQTEQKRPQPLRDPPAGMISGTTTWPPPREVRSSQGIGGVSAGTGSPHFALNRSHKSGCVKLAVHAGSLGGPDGAGGSLARCVLGFSRPRRMHRKPAAAAATGASSEAAASSMPLAKDGCWPLGSLSTTTPALRSRESMRSLSADRTIRTPRSCSATVESGGRASSSSSNPAAPAPAPASPGALCSEEGILP